MSMTAGFTRLDTSVVGRWWWTVDRWSLGALLGVIGVGCMLMLAASPAVASRIGLDGFHFVKRHLVMLPPTLFLLFACSLLSPQSARRFAVFGFIGTVGLLCLVLVAGAEIKGARRWINLAGFSLQPSEFLKPFFAVVAAWMFSEQKKAQGAPGFLIAIGLYGLSAGLLVLQPDLGQTIVLTTIFFTQFFLAGLPLVLVAGGAVLGAFGLVGAYFLLPHVQSRIDRFLDPNAGDTFQVAKSMEAFASGGLWGRGPGEGVVKSSIPDVHADFIFAVAGEEFGLITCLVIVSLFGFITLRGFTRLIQESNLFIVLAGAGLLVQFGMQAFINMASTLHLIPTKGMTLPFISYGGSSMLALAIGMGLLLALTRRRYGGGDA